MPLTAGTRLGPYEIVGPLGAGGMGEVYRARDTRLDRSVAVKVLPRELSGDAERRERLQREARTLASLSHPRVCPLFDVGEHGGTVYLVMEHLEGETLALRLVDGALPLAEALAVAVQIAEGLDAAHRLGIVHRDLKPGNVMLTRTGAVLLDFGLARLRAARALDRNASTEAAPLTGAGAVLGTLQYMAPEQLEGAPVDARADLWALGAMLYEMVAGKRPFSGESAASLTAAILEREPRPLAEAMPLAPRSLDRLVMRCLTKRPEERWESARDLADALRWISEDLAGGAPNAPDAARPRWRRVLTAVALAAAGLLSGAVLVWIARPGSKPARQPVVRSLLDVSPADRVGFTGESTPGGARHALAWTPDGGAVAFPGVSGASWQLFLRPLDGATARAIEGTERGLVPAFSPDGRWVAFWSGRAIRKVPLAGGPSTVIAEGIGRPTAMEWGRSGILVFDDWKERQTVVKQVTPGGQVQPVTRLGEGELDHRCPHLLPGDVSVLFTVRRRTWSWGDEEVVAQDLATGGRKVLLRNAADARYVAPGRLLFMRQGTLFGVPFDPVKVEVRGEEVALAEGIAQALSGGISGLVTGVGQLAVSSAGDLAYLASPVIPFGDSRLVTVDRSGRVERLALGARSFAGTTQVSPDGSRVAVTIQAMTEVGLWIYDLSRGTLSKLTPDDGEAEFARWTPDGHRLAYNWIAAGIESLDWRPADGSSPPEKLARGRMFPSSWSPDGRALAVVKDDDVWVLEIGDGAPRLRPVVQSPGFDLNPAFSPDGRWLVYVSTSSGRDEVYLQPYPGPGPRLQVSVDGGSSPLWNPNGREILFVGPREASPEDWSSMMSVEVVPGPPTKLGAPRRLFDGVSACVQVNCWSISPDGQRLFTTQAVKADPPPPATHINLVLNWRAELEAKVPSGV